MDLVADLAGREPAVVAATFCATLVDEWVRSGVTEAAVAPGSRSTPMALALAADARIRVHVFLDERSAGFFALGVGLRSGIPAVVLTTSGTAAAELHAAVVEAHHAGVPLLAVTADRPPEAQRVGAPQTIEQAGIYGAVVRWEADPGVPEAAASPAWRSLASRAVLEARGAGGRPGPVHLNLAFREPLVGSPAPLPPGRPEGPWHEAPAARSALPADVSGLAGRLSGRRGVVVTGAGTQEPGPVHALAAALGWPVLADPRSACRAPHPGTVAAFDALLRHEGFSRWARPEVVLRLGAAPASRVLSTWLSGSSADQLAVDATGTWYDPEHTAAAVVRADPAALCAALLQGGVEPAPPDWGRGWARAEEAAQSAIEACLAAHPEPTEPGVARSVASCLPVPSVLVTASSMPVRDLEWYAAPRPGLSVLANRGANGIDGTVGTVLGVAAAGRGTPTVGLIGDLALLHDSNGLLGASRRPLDAVLVVVDNRGGGIFSFLPQARSVSGPVFEQLFGTPHDLDIAALGRLHGLAVDEPEAAADVAPAVLGGLQAGGVRLVVVRTEREANVAVHGEIHAAVAAAVERVVAG